MKMINLLSLMVTVLACTKAYLVAAESDREMCQDARSKCLFRSGCGMAMQNYLVHCADVMTGRGAGGCSKTCQHSLIALMSTEEGQTLMRCKCSDTYCENQKERIDICRPHVQAALRSTAAMPCNVATYLCLADAQCQTALDYYNHNCRAMFDGRKCTLKCKNSISILRKQDKAENLWTCKCDGSEDYDCEGIRENMSELCFRNKKEPETTSVATTLKTTTFPAFVPEVENEVKIEERPPSHRPSDRAKVPKKVKVEKTETEVTVKASSSKCNVTWMTTLMIMVTFVVRWQS